MIIAEDETSILNFIAGCIDREALGITEIYTCSNGEEAIRLIDKYDADVVLTDINMPKIDGLELIKRSKILFENVKFVVISGYDDFHLVKEAFKLGVSDYILKSELVPSELMKIVKALLEKKSESNFPETKSLNLLKETRLKELFWGSKNIEKDDSKYKFRFDSENFCVAVFKILNFDCILKNDWDCDRELLKYGLSNLINEILDGFNFGEAVSGYNNEIVFIFSLSEDKSKNDILRIIAEIKKHVSLYFNFKFRIGISVECGTDPKALYINAARAADYCFISKSELSDSDDISKDNKPVTLQIKKLTEEFEKNVLNFNFQPVINNFSKFTFTYVPLMQYEDVLILYRNYFNILNVIKVQHQWLSNMELRCDEIIKNETLDTLNGHFMEILIKLQSTFSNEENVVGQVKKYIDENYHKNISPDSISLLFCIDSRKLAREFAKSYGLTVSKYITDVRMKRAMQLITTSDFLLYEIAEMVGYVNYESFSRTFYGYWRQWPKNVKP